MCLRDSVQLSHRKHDHRLVALLSRRNGDARTVGGAGGRRTSRASSRHERRVENEHARRRIVASFARTQASVNDDTAAAVAGGVEEG